MFKNLIRFLFPPRCIFCGYILETDVDMEICENCFCKIPFMKDGIIKSPESFLHGGGCEYTICACNYTGILKDSIKKFKFYDKAGYYRAFAGLLSDRIKKMTNFREFDIITCVPLSKRKESIRGYNQSLLISKEVGKKLGIPVNPRLLVRERDTKSQSLLTKCERYSNVAGAFKVTNANDIKGKTVLLVDDIMTTGNTLNECGRTLLKAGAEKVIGAVIASGRRR